jgi:hypothetical protein
MEQLLRPPYSVYSARFVSSGLSEASYELDSGDEFGPGLDAFDDIIVGRSLTVSGCLLLTDSTNDTTFLVVEMNLVRFGGSLISTGWF